MFERILVVCVGNICRSPTAALLLQHRLDGRGFDVASAGLAAMTDQPIDPMAGELLAEHGIDGSGHRARQLTSELLHRYDLVLGMEKSHLARMIQIAPEATGKMFLLDKWGASRDVPDPYRQPRGMFERVFAMIEQGVGSWMPYLN